MISSISEIQGLAQKIDYRINLFEGYCPKSIINEKNESLFWRKIVNIYGLFADCDSIQIKRKSNLFSLMQQYSFITKDEFTFVRDFWNDVSALRKWFCHNTDANLYYQGRNIKHIEKFLDKALIISTEKPKTMDQLQSTQWSLVNADIDRRFDEYLKILKKGLLVWGESEDKSEVVEEWIEIFSKALFADNELNSNVIADLALFEIRNYGIDTSLSIYSKIIQDDLCEKGYSSEDIKKYISNMDSHMDSKTILLEVMKLKREQL